MRIIEPYFEVLNRFHLTPETLIFQIEQAGRTAYKTEVSIDFEKSKKFVANLIKKGHESVIEHVSISVKVVCDRGITHEIVRHRIASYTQESTRYCNYSDNRFDNEVTFIRPCFWKVDDERYKIWKNTMQGCELIYLDLLKRGATPQEARSVLPNSLKTEIVITMNLREWRHFFKLRTSNEAHPQMREITIPMLNEFSRIVPVIFDDI